jgi:hypothetical protein
MNALRPVNRFAAVHGDSRQTPTAAKTRWLTHVGNRCAQRLRFRSTPPPTQPRAQLRSECSLKRSDVMCRSR